MRSTVLLTVAVLVLTASVLTAASLAASQGGAVVKVGQSTVGRVLVDSHGKTLYMWVSVFDHTQTRHTRHVRPIKIITQE